MLLGALMTILDATIVNVAINSLGRDFHTSLPTIQWVLTGYTLALSMTIPITGWAVERIGSKALWITSLALFIAGSVLCGMAWSAASLIAFRVLQGVGGGMLMPVGQTILARAAGPKRMGRLMAVVAVPAMLAPVLGPVLGGLIVNNLSWRWMFYVNVPLCAVALIMAIRAMPADTDRSPTARLDLRGLALLSPGLAALVYGLSAVGNGSPVTSASVLAGVVAGAILVAAFGWHALRKGERALIDLGLFRNRAFTSAAGTLFAYSAAVFGLVVLLPLYIQLVRGESALAAGLLLAPWGLGAIVTMPISGRITDSRGARGVCMAGLAVALAGAAACALVEANTPHALLAGAVFVVGLGHGLIIPSLMATVYQDLPRSAVPSATTTSNILLRVGSSLGIAILAVVLQIYIRASVPEASGDLAAASASRTPQNAELLADAFGDSIWWTVGIGALALLTALRIPRHQQSPQPAG
jgi:EmrB/QacA subfamily drug resistance transporter